MFVGSTVYFINLFAVYFQWNLQIIIYTIHQTGLDHEGLNKTYKTFPEHLPLHLLGDALLQPQKHLQTCLIYL